MNNPNLWLEMAAAFALAAIGYVLTVFVMAQGGPH